MQMVRFAGSNRVQRLLSQDCIETFARRQKNLLAHFNHGQSVAPLQQI
jgi:hypothetical protein